MAKKDVEVRTSGGVNYASLPDLKELVTAMKNEGNVHVHIDVLMGILQNLDR